MANHTTNKPTTLGYFIRRMKSCGYSVQTIFSDYSESDARNWTVIIDPGGASVLCTCFTNRSSLGDNCFEFYDGGQFLPNQKIKTDSFEVIIKYLTDHNILAKPELFTPEIP